MTNSFDYIIGNGLKDVTIEYEIKDGAFKQLYVLMNTEFGPIDILEYLSTYEVDLVKWKCKQDVGEQTICTS
jgi:hypothetical protein